MKLIHGDCIGKMKDIESNSIDMVMTSPPYDNLRDYGKDFTGWGEYIWKPCLEQIFRVLKDGGVCVWVVGDATINGSETGTSFRQALYWMEIGGNLHDTMIYLKPNFSAVGALQTRYAPVFEYMFVLSKNRIKTFNPIKDRKCKTAGSKKSGTIRQKDGTTKKKSNIGTIQKDFGQRYNVWEINPETSLYNHPAPFPLKLAKDHIISWSNENDIILDPFMGSGTTGVACIDLNRDFIGIELDEGYFNISQNRIKEAQSQGRLF